MKINIEYILHALASNGSQHLLLITIDTTIKKPVYKHRLYLF